MFSKEGTQVEYLFVMGNAIYFEQIWLLYNLSFFMCVSVEG